jgi:glyoxylase-like metal-dependent hydrolase (beta-lactamase superfamily II)
MKHVAAFLASLILLSSVASAKILNVEAVAPGIWAIEGPAEQRSPENLGNNATFGLIETNNGAVLVDPGATWLGAAMLHAVVRELTNQPVTHVINTGGQDHRWLGNGYWRAQGASIIASKTAVTDQAARGSLQLTILSQLVGSGLEGTEPAQANIVFETSYDLEVGGRHIEIHYPGPAHTPGDSFVWLPAEQTVFTGDIVFIGRVLGVMEFSDSAAWLEAFSAIEALAPMHVIPGHGPASTLAKAQADTRDYLMNLRSRMRDYIDAGGDIIGSVDIDQSAFSYLDQFDVLSRRNAQAVFEQMEWE